MTKINTPNLTRSQVRGGIIFLLVIGVIYVASLWIAPWYWIYKQNLEGQANLRQQEWEKRILIEEAKAKKEAAVLEAEAEVERAKGVAKANEIIAGGLQGREEYLRYLWINQLSNGGNQVIYVPTEAGLPLLEAGKR